MQLADRDSIIRCLEMTSTDLKLQVDELTIKCNHMVPRCEYQSIEHEHSVAQDKIASCQKELIELQGMVDSYNTEKAQSKQSLQEIADKYLLAIKAIKSELSAVKHLASEQISEARKEIKHDLLT